MSSSTLRIASLSLSYCINSSCILWRERGHSQGQFVALPHPPWHQVNRFQPQQQVEHRSETKPWHTVVPIHEAPNGSTTRGWDLGLGAGQKMRHTACDDSRRIEIFGLGLKSGVGSDLA